MPSCEAACRCVHVACTVGYASLAKFVYTNLVSTSYWHFKLDDLKSSSAAKTMSVLARALSWAAMDVKSMAAG